MKLPVVDPKQAGLFAEATRPLSVVLVRPPTLTAPRSLSYYGTVLPLGLAYVAAAARAAGHRVRVVDAPGLAPERRGRMSTPVGDLVVHGLDAAAIVDAVGEGADVIGIGHTFVHEWGLVRELVARLRAASPEAFIVAGGENASAYWARMLEQAPGLDACVRGEGELTTVALLDALGRGAPLRRVPGLALRIDGRPTTTAAAVRIDDVDALPRPAWDLLPVDVYLDRRWGAGVDRGRSMPVLTSRGCPYRCSFCSSPQMWTTRYRRRDPARVVDEIAGLVARYRIDNVDIADLTAMLTKRWIVELCDAITQRDLSVTMQLPSGTRSEAIDREAAERLVAAGCTNLCYAPESGSRATLKAIDKRVEPDRLLASLRGATAAGMKTHASLIIGFPHERRRDVLATAVFALRMAAAGLHGLSVLAFSPYPGSAEYDALAAEGRIADDDRDLYGSLLRSAAGRASWSPVLGPRTLQAVQLSVLAAFFATSWARRPWRAGQAAVAVVRRRQATVLDQFLATKASQIASSMRQRAGRWLRRGRGLVLRSG